MHIDQIRNHCLAKKGTTEEFPFDQDTLVFKVMNKMFVIAPLDKWERGEATLTLKCDPDYTMELRDRYESIYPGPYVSNKHWNTVDLFTGELHPEFVLELIDHSYDMVVKGMPKRLRDELF
ncbi:MAG: MmcQ/YjbR family DNA-binding protein [Flavobacteriaceae bacterium]|nr:MmcQ/YjbR family DNA-binding protein [Flavobacteriaceae bacterium]